MVSSREKEAALETEQPWHSRAGMVVAAVSCALPGQAQQPKAPREHLKLCRENTERVAPPSGGILRFSKLLWRLGVMFAFCILSFQINADPVVTFTPEVGEPRRFMGS